MWRSGLVEFGMSIGENGSCYVNFHIPRHQQKLSWFPSPKMRKTKQTLPLNSRLKTVKMAVANVWRPCALCNQATGDGGFPSQPSPRHFQVMWFSRRCRSLWDRMVGPSEGWRWDGGRKNGLKGTSTTCGCGVWERQWNLKRSLGKARFLLFVCKLLKTSYIYIYILYIHIYVIFQPLMSSMAWSRYCRNPIYSAGLNTPQVEGWDGLMDREWSSFWDRFAITDMWLHEQQ